MKCNDFINTLLEAARPSQGLRSHYTLAGGWRWAGKESRTRFQLHPVYKVHYPPAGRLDSAQLLMLKCPLLLEGGPEEQAWEPSAVLGSQVSSLARPPLWSSQPTPPRKWRPRFYLIFFFFCFTTKKSQQYFITRLKKLLQSGTKLNIPKLPDATQLKIKAQRKKSSPARQEMRS